MTTQSLRNPRHFTSTFFASAAIACFAYSVLALLLLHLLRPDISPAEHMISAYAIGPYGWVMTTVFIAMSCGFLSLSLGLLCSGPQSVAAWLGSGLPLIAFVGGLISATFPAGEIHELSFLANVGSLILSLVLLSVSFFSDSRWRSYAITAVMLGALVIVAFILLFLVPHPGLLFGFVNRSFTALLFAWLLATSIRLRALARK
jgi:hypothetical protein